MWLRSKSRVNVQHPGFGILLTLGLVSPTHLCAMSRASHIFGKFCFPCSSLIWHYSNSMQSVNHTCADHMEGTFCAPSAHKWAGLGDIPKFALVTCHLHSQALVFLAFQTVHPVMMVFCEVIGYRWPDVDKGQCGVCWLLIKCVCRCLGH